MNQDHNQPEPLKCPRCDSSNTKFCYYNNYNKSQPRHFCKACKRHWTKGGTLRNVPVGGGRKNKRPHKPSGSGNGKIINKVNPKMVIQAQQNKKPKQSTEGGGRASSSPNDIVFSSGVTDHPSLKLPSPMGPPAESDSVVANFDDEEGIGFVFSQGLSFPNYSASSSAISTSSAAVASFDGQFLGLPSGAAGYTPATWQVPSTIGGGSGNMNDMASGGGGYWNWDVDMDNLVSSADLNIPWDDSEIKPCD
ncbi:unnamed protein product [Linum tenue]|uniref:Dof zinc finger protein n=1 Tax=Linum tenue TaxID=586396 RepID=A0AAV0PCE7_9ROSI|nr:unnamed protein product [Linum tenue]